MLTSTIISLLAAATVTIATPVEPKLAAENAPNTVLVAELPESKTSTVRGSITFTSPKDSVGVDGAVVLKGLPKTGGPFTYHIHASTVPGDGNCTATGGHFDPYEAASQKDYKCDPKKPTLCEIGDLSGKQGAITTSNGEFSAKWTDRYISTDSTDKYAVNKLSIVVHSADKTRLTCANFVLKTGGASPSGAPIGGKNGTTTNGTVNTGGPSPTSKPNQPSSAAHKLAAGAGVFGFAAMAFFL